MRWLKLAIPFIGVSALLLLLGNALFSESKVSLPSTLLNQPLPSFNLPDLHHSQQYFQSKELTGKVSLLNIWATWCYACAMEHDVLMDIKEKYHVAIYSINYKDQALSAKQWLSKKGNPYVKTGSDEGGDVAIDLGIYGTPETFVVSPQGKILYRHVGALTHQVWVDVLYPIIKQYDNER